MNALLAHQISFVILIFLFLFCLVLHHRGDTKTLRWMKRLLRTFYLLAIASGTVLVIRHSFSVLALLKAASAFWLIFAMEMTLVRHLQNRPAGLHWVQIIMAFGLVCYLGYEWL